MSIPISLLDEQHSTSVVDLDTLVRLDDLFFFYHKQWWYRRQSFYRFKKFNAILNGIALLIMAISVVVASVWEHSFVVVGLTSFATLLKGWNDFKKYAFKMDMCKFAYTTYEKALIELRSYVRSGMNADDLDEFLIKMQTLDDTITDFTPPVMDSYVREYEKKFRREPICEGKKNAYNRDTRVIRQSSCTKGGGFVRDVDVSLANSSSSVEDSFPSFR